MSKVFFDDLSIPRPDANLSIGSGKQGEQTGAMIAALERQFETLEPDAVIVYGDTNSTLAACIAASKMHIPQFHVEAGLRSFDRRMPEEINRIVADHCSELLLAPTAQAMRNLETEGLAARALQVGDVMYDAVLYNADIAERTSKVLSDLNLAGRQYAVVTVHRASNTEPGPLSGLMEALQEIADHHLPVVFPMHPRTRVALKDSSAWEGSNLRIVEPQPYLDMLSLVKNARIVLTDSGGLQKEAAFLGKPCVTLRDSTEWVETIEIGANTLTGLSRDAIRDAVQGILDQEAASWANEIPALYGHGKAADSIASAIIQWIKGAKA